MTARPAGESASRAVAEDDDFYERTRFWRAARRYGFRYLLLTWGWACSAAAGAIILGLYLHDCLDGNGLKALGVAYLSLGAALFGIVLAGLAVVAAFFDREYVRELRSRQTLDKALFSFWWVAAIAVLALLISVALTVVVYIDASRVVTAVVLTAATVFFVAALLEALSLVGTLMRHGLYRAELIAESDGADSSRPKGNDAA